MRRAGDETWRMGVRAVRLASCAAALVLSVAFAAAPSSAQQADGPQAGAEASLPLDGTDAAAYRRRAVRYLDAQDLDRAVADYDEVLKLAPDDIEALRGRATTLFGLARYRDAVNDLSKVIEKAPEDGKSHALRAVCLAVLQETPGTGFRNKAEFQTALADYEAALRLLPAPDEQSALLFGRGEFLANGGRAADALKDFEAAVKIDPAVTYLVRLAAARQEAGDRPGAREALERALAAPWSADGSSARARRDLTALRGPDEPPLELPSLKDLKAASAEVVRNQQGEPVVRLTFDDDGRTRFAEFTAQNVGRRVDLVLGDEVLVSATVREPIVAGSVEITMLGDEEAAKKLSGRLSHGETVEARAAE